MRHTLKEYYKLFKQVDTMLGRQKKRRERELLNALWLDFQTAAADKDSRICLQFDDRKEWLSPDETERFIFLTRGFGFAISGTGHVDKPIPPEKLALIYHITKHGEPPLPVVRIAED